MQATAHAELYAPPEIDRAKYIADAVGQARKHRWAWRSYQVAEEGGRILGVVGTMHQWIIALYVDGASRSRGVGSALLAAAEARLLKEGFGEVRLSVAREQTPVHEFYQRRGWRLQPLEEASADHNWGIPLIQMTKRIAEIDPHRHKVAGIRLKAQLILAALALIALSLYGLHAGGAMTGIQAVLAGIVLGICAGSYVVQLDGVNFTSSGVRIRVAAVAGSHVVLLVAIFSLAALGLHATGVAAPRALATGIPEVPKVWVIDRRSEQMGVILIGLSCIAADQIARHGLNWLWRRYSWLLA